MPTFMLAAMCVLEDTHLIATAHETLMELIMQGLVGYRCRVPTVLGRCFLVLRFSAGLTRPCRCLD